MHKLRLYWLLLWSVGALASVVHYVDWGQAVFATAMIVAGIAGRHAMYHRRSLDGVFTVLAILLAIAAWGVLGLVLWSTHFHQFWLPTLVFSIGITGQLVLGRRERRKEPRGLGAGRTGRS